MKKFLAAAGLVAAASSAHASLFTETHNITSSGEGSVGYSYFEVTTAGYFNFYTMGPTIDPVLYLFEDDGVLGTDDSLTWNDDSCSTSLCGPAGAFRNSLISNYYLDLGSYFLAVSDFGFSASEVVSGLNSNNLTGNVTIVADIGSLDSGNAYAVLSSSATSDVPEPSSLALMSLGMLGLAGWARKKRKA